MSRALEEISVAFTILGFKSAKISYLQKISLLSAVFIKLKYRLLQTLLADLLHKHLKFCL